MPKIAASITDRERIVLAEILTSAQFEPTDSANVTSAFREFDLELAAANVGARNPMTYKNHEAAAIEVSTESASFVLKVAEAKITRPGYAVITLAPFAERLKASLGGGN